MPSSYLNYRARCIGYPSYTAYLQSPQWRMFREQVKANACYCCGSRGADLQVHHTNYDHLGAEKPEDVMTVCNACHEAIHGKVKNGGDLETAHEQHALATTTNDRVKPKKQEWVSWFELLNKSKHQSLAELRTFLVDQGLSDGKRATQKAYGRGLVRLIDGKERWNIRKYIRIMQADKKRKKRAEKALLV